MELEREKVKKAVQALYAVLQKTYKSKFIDEPERIDLQIALKKIPKLKDKTLRLKLPHSLKRDTTEVCLFVKDLKKHKRDYEPTVLHYKELLEKHGITEISEIIPMQSLRTEYKPIEAKRVLSNRFDVFLADNCIFRLLPDYLGKNFYGRKRIPVGVNLNANNLKKEVNKALDSGRCIISGRGSSCAAIIAHEKMAQGDVVDNIIASANQIAAGVPGGPKNIKNMYIKSPASISIPIYFGNELEEVTLPAVERKVEKIVPEDVTTVVGSKVVVSKFGEVKLVSEKKRGAEDGIRDPFSKRKKRRKDDRMHSRKKSKKFKGTKKVNSGLKQPVKLQKPGKKKKSLHKDPK